MIDLCGFNLESDRLILQPISHIYREDIFREFQGEVTRYTCGDPPRVIEETDRFIHLSLLNLITGDDLTLVILDRETREFLGCSGVHGLKSPSPSLGIWLKKTSQGKGYGGEVISTLVKWIRDNFTFDIIRYEVDRDNIPSRRIVESLGGKIIHQGGEIQRITNSGKVLNLMIYTIDLK